MPHPITIVKDARLLLVAGVPCDDALGLGDLLRVVMMLPALQAANVGWCSPPHMFALVQDCREIQDLILLDQLSEVSSQYDIIINLSFANIPNTIGMSDLLGGDEPLKQRTFDMVRALADRLGITPPPPQPVARTPENTQTIGFNFRLPAIWEIKAMPESLWLQLPPLLPKDMLISWQPELGLNDYIDWVKRCRILISTVGLGCHVAMFYGLPLVVLSGPTDFAEIHEYPMARVLYPTMACSERPCQKPQGVNGCGGCMQYFSPHDIANAVSDLLLALPPKRGPL